MAALREANPEHFRSYRLRKARELRAEVLRRYGGDPPTCACCGEHRDEFLTVDHVDGDGAEHRREIGQGQLYPWLKRNDWPEGFRVLCANCNWSRGVRGYCPHERERLRVVA